MQHAMLITCILPIPQVGPGWSCKLDGEQGLRHCHHDQLHAMEPPAGDLLLEPFVVKVLEAELPLARVDEWLKTYQEDPPVDLVRIWPDATLWYEVLIGQRSIASLSDAEVVSLHYVAAGGQQLLAGDIHTAWAQRGTAAQAHICSVPCCHHLSTIMQRTTHLKTWMVPTLTRKRRQARWQLAFTASGRVCRRPHAARGQSSLGAPMPPSAAAHLR